MEIAVSRQLYEAGTALLFGCMAGIVYDVMRIIRRRLPWGWLTFLLDLVFSLGCGGGLFILGLSAGGGRQRLFMVIFACIGGVFYFTAVSRLILAILGIIADILEKILLITLRPFEAMWRGVKKFYFLLKNVFHYERKWYKIKYTQEQCIPGSAVPSRKDSYHENKKKALRRHN